MKSTRIVFMGTPDFAVAVLTALHENYSVTAVVTQPDRPSGRGKKLTPPPVKNAAQKLDIPVVQPDSVREKSFIRWLENEKPDYVVTAAFGRILPEQVLQVPVSAALNVHASLLPAYRGAAPIHRAIMNGETKSGVTIMEMDKGMDTGDIILQKAVTIENQDTAGILHDKLAVLGAGLIVSAIKKVSCGDFEKRPQKESLATYAPPLKKPEERINWCADAMTIHNHVRGMNPWPGAYTELNGKRLKVWAGQPADNQGSPCGRVLTVSQDGIVVAAGDGAYCITRLQPPGKKAMAADDFLRGHPIDTETVLGKGR